MTQPTQPTDLQGALNVQKLEATALSLGLAKWLQAPPAQITLSLPVEFLASCRALASSEKESDLLLNATLRYFIINYLAIADAERKESAKTNNPQRKETKK